MKQLKTKHSLLGLYRCAVVYLCRNYFLWELLVSHLISCCNNGFIYTVQYWFVATMTSCYSISVSTGGFKFLCIFGCIALATAGMTIHYIARFSWVQTLCQTFRFMKHIQNRHSLMNSMLAFSSNLSSEIEKVYL